MADRGRSTISQQDVQVTSRQIAQRRRRRRRTRMNRLEHLHRDYPDPMSQFPEIVARFDPWRCSNRSNELAPFYLHMQRNNDGLWTTVPSSDNVTPPSQQLQLQPGAMHDGRTQFQNNIMQRMIETLDARYVRNTFQYRNQGIMHGPSMASNDEQILIYIRQQRILQNYATTHSVPSVLHNQHLGNVSDRNQQLENGYGFNQNRYLGNGFNQYQYMGNVFDRNQHLGNGYEIQQNQQVQLQTSVHSQMGNMGGSRMIGNAFPDYQQVRTMENPRVVPRDTPSNGTRSMENNWDPFEDILGQARVATVIANCDNNSDHNHANNAYITPEQGQAQLEPPAFPTDSGLSSLLQDMVPKDNIVEDEESLVDESFFDDLLTAPPEWPDINIDQV